MIDKIAGIHLLVTLGMCVVAFPFVLSMLFSDNGPRFRPMRHIVRPREDDSTDFSGRSEDAKKGPSGYDGARRVRRPLYMERGHRNHLSPNPPEFAL